MSFGALHNRVGHAVRKLMNSIHRENHRGRVDDGLVFAVTNCYPTRVVLYAAAFQGGWTVEFVRSLSDTVALTRFRRPKAVLYENTGDAKGWERHCAALADE